MRPGEFLDALHTYCALTNASVTSAGRTLTHNAAVGGVAHSAHCAWLAADVIYDAPVELSTREAWARRLGLLLVVEHDHDHLQPMLWTAG